MLFVNSCCRTVMSSESVQDSIRVEYRDVVREIVKDTTVYVHLPVEKYKAVENNYSHLETLFSTSIAWVDSLSRLNHSLETKHIPVTTTIQYVDREVVKDSIVYVYRDREVEVMKEKKRINWGVMFAFFLLGAIFVQIIRGLLKR